MLGAIVAGGASLLLYLFFLSTGIYAGDSGDLVAAAAQMGIPHPPGYPLYTFLAWALTHLPVSTIAWRVGLLSAIPQAITVGCVYFVTWRLCRRHGSAFFASLVLVFNYVYFLYSVTAEVFGLLDLFVVGFLIVAERWTIKRPSFRLLAYTAILAGLSLTHHSIIVCFVPAALYLLKAVPVKKMSLGQWMTLVGVGLCGLVALAYIPIAARGTAAVNWDRPVTVTRFVHLITRGDYGTFQSGTSIESGIYQRLLSIKAYWVFMIVDFTPIGVVLVLLGLWWIYQHRPTLFYFWIISIVCIGPLFAFYANFPLAGRFALGTLERFLLPSYVLYAPLIGLGVLQGTVVFSHVVHRLTHTRSTALLQSMLYIVLLLYPITVGTMTLWRFWGIQKDQTAQMLGRDILASSPHGAIVLLVHDTPLFVSQYMRYGLGKRPDLLLVHLARLPYPDYQEVLRIQSPSVVFPSPRSEGYVTEFIKANRASRPIVSNSVVPIGDGWAWVPHGLLYLLVDTTHASQTNTYIQENERLWKAMHNPNAGILARYKHLMLSNVLDEYALASIAFGDALLGSGNYQEAKVYFTRAVDYGSDGQEYTARTRLGITLSLLKDCKGALDSFSRASKVAAASFADLFKYEGITYRDCVGDAGQAKLKFDAYDAEIKKSETPLERL